MFNVIPAPDNYLNEQYWDIIPNPFIKTFLKFCRGLVAKPLGSLDLETKSLQGFLVVNQVGFGMTEIIVKLRKTRNNVLMYLGLNAPHPSQR